MQRARERADDPLRRTPATRTTSRLSRRITAGLLLAACSSGGSSSEPDAEVHRTEFDPANFVDPTTSTNELHPLTPGMQWVRGGTTEVGGRAVSHQVVTTMTDVVRMIDGVPAVATVLVVAATLVTTIAATSLVNRLNPTELLRDE